MAKNSLVDEKDLPDDNFGDGSFQLNLSDISGISGVSDLSKDFSGIPAIPKTAASPMREDPFQKLDHNGNNNAIPDRLKGNNFNFQQNQNFKNINGFDDIPIQSKAAQGINSDDDIFANIPLGGDNNTLNLDFNKSPASKPITNIPKGFEAVPMDDFPEIPQSNSKNNFLNSNPMNGFEAIPMKPTGSDEEPMKSTPLSTQPQQVKISNSTLSNTSNANKQQQQTTSTSSKRLLGNGFLPSIRSKELLTSGSSRPETPKEADNDDLFADVPFPDLPSGGGQDKPKKAPIQATSTISNTSQPKQQQTSINQPIQQQTLTTQNEFQINTNSIASTTTNASVPQQQSQQQQPIINNQTPQSQINMNNQMQQQPTTNISNQQTNPIQQQQTTNQNIQMPQLQQTQQPFQQQNQNLQIGQQQQQQNQQINMQQTIQQQIPSPTTQIPQQNNIQDQFQVPVMMSQQTQQIPSPTTQIPQQQQQQMPIQNQGFSYSPQQNQNIQHNLYQMPQQNQILQPQMQASPIPQPQIQLQTPIQQQQQQQQDQNLFPMPTSFAQYAQQQQQQQTPQITSQITSPSIQTTTTMSPYSPYSPIYTPIQTQLPIELGFSASLDRSMSNFKRMFTSEFSSIIRQQPTNSQAFEVDDFADKLSSEIAAVIEAPIPPMDINSQQITRRIASSIDEQTKPVTSVLAEAEARNTASAEHHISELKQLQEELESLRTAFKTNSDNIIRELERERQNSAAIRDSELSHARDIEQKLRSLKLREVELDTRSKNQAVEKDSIERSLKQFEQKKREWEDETLPKMYDEGSAIRRRILDEISSLRNDISQESFDDLSAVINDGLKVIKDEGENLRNELIDLEMANRWVMSRARDVVPKKSPSSKRLRKSTVLDQTQEKLNRIRRQRQETMKDFSDQLA